MISVSISISICQPITGNNFANFYKSQRRKEAIQEKRNALDAKKKEGLISDDLNSSGGSA